MLLAGLAVTSGFGLASGCGQAYEMCEAVCECTHCNDRTRDSCEIEVDRMIEVAAAYECEAEADAYFECVLADNECEDTQFTADDCNMEELVDLLECIADSSELIGAISGSGPSSPSSTTTSMTSASGGSGGAGGGPTNQAPVASFVISPTCTMSSIDPVTVTSTSTDPDGDVLSCSWVFTSGTPSTGTECVMTGVTFPNAAPYTITLTVSDGQSSAMAAQTIAPCP